MKKLLAILILSIFVLLAVGCGSGGGTTGAGPSSAIPTTPPAIQGTITSAVQGAILVEENPQDSSGSSKIMLRLTTGTQILTASGDTAGQSGLTVGKKVRAWVNGPVATSYPLQGEAAVVVIDG